MGFHIHDLLDITEEETGEVSCEVSVNRDELWLAGVDFDRPRVRGWWRTKRNERSRNRRTDRKACEESTMSGRR